MKRIVLAASAVLLAVTVVTPAVVAGPETGPKLALHIKATTSKVATICSTYTPNVDGTPCSQYVVDWPALQDALVYLVIAQVDTPSFNQGVRGVTLGIEYNGNDGVGVDVTSWSICADGLEVPNGGTRGDWPEAGGGNVITWIDCQQNYVGTEGIHAVVGAFQVYSYGADYMKITPNRNFQGPDVMLLADCSAVETELDTTGATYNHHPTGWAAFGNTAQVGCNPCGLQDCSVPVEPTTWGKIKTQFR